MSKLPLNMSTQSLGRSTSGNLNASYTSNSTGKQQSGSLQTSGLYGQASTSFAAPSGSTVPLQKLPVKHKTLASEAFLADAADNEQKRLIAAGRAVPHVQGGLANAHRAPTPAIVRQPEVPEVRGGDGFVASPQKASYPSSGFGAPSERIAPARLRASPVPTELRATPGLGASGAVSASQMRDLLKRPASAPKNVSVDASGRLSTMGGALPSLVDGPAGRSFEDELLEIAAHRFGPDASKRHEQRSEASRGPSVMGFAGSSKTPHGDGAASSLGRTPSPPAGMSDAYEEGATTAEEDWSNPTTATGKPLHVPYTPDIRARLSAGAAPHSHVKPKPMSLADYRMLAQACQRAGRAVTECHAYYKIAEILSGDRETLPKSIPYFKRYLNLCRRLADLQGEAKALNALGIVYHRLGGHNNISIALTMHQQHMEIADAAGIFIAQTNRGLIFRALGQPDDAMEALKQALHYAVRAGDRQAEALALANLGLAGTSHGDLATARVCVERQLELNTALQDAAGSCEAYEHLGELAMQRGDATGASELLVMALDLALKAGDQATARRVRCHIGVVQAMARTEERMQQVASGMGAAVGGR